MSEDNPWPSGESKPVILLSDGPSELSRKHGLHFLRDVDDLDVCHYCYALDKDVGTILFHFYVNSPAKGTAIYVDRGVETVFAINKLMANFAIHPSEVKWVQSDM